MKWNFPFDFKLLSSYLFTSIFRKQLKYSYFYLNSKRSKKEFCGIFHQGEYYHNIQSKEICTIILTYMLSLSYTIQPYVKCLLICITIANDKEKINRKDMGMNN